MSRGVRLLVGAATLVPILYLGGFVGFWIALALGVVSGQMKGAVGLEPSTMGIFIASQCLMSAWVVGLLVFYLVDLFRNPNVPAESRTLWAVVLFLGNIVAMPIYWALYLRGDAAPAPATKPPPG